MMRRLATILIILLGLFSPQMLLAANFTQRLNFQGKLSDTGAAANGTYNIKFELCSASDCSTVIWTEYHDAANAGQVTVTNGIFNTILGTDEALTSVDFDQALWIRITVDGTGASPSYATPLGIIPLGSTPAAQEAKSLSGLDLTRFAVVDADGENMLWNSTITASIWADRGIVAFGNDAGEENPSNPFLNASNNTSIGSHAGTAAANTSDSVFVGTNAGVSVFSGADNVLVGSSAAYSAIASSQNVYLGSEAGYSSTASAGVFIGYRAGYSETANERLYIENSSSTLPLIYGEFDNDIVRINGQLQSTGGIAIGSTSTDNLIDDASNGASSATLYIGNETIDTSVSDRRLKTNISPAETSALSYLSQFNVVAFDWLEGNERRADGRVPFGLIAQDVAEIAPQYTKQGDNPEDYMSVRFQDMVPLTIKAIQEIDARVSALEVGGVRGAVNSVTNLVELVVDRLRVRNELCIGDTCVDEATLKELLSDDGEAVSRSTNGGSPLPTPNQAEEPQEPQVEPVQETASTTESDLQDAPTEVTASTTPADVLTDEPGEGESQPEESEEEPVETEEVLEEQEAESAPAPEPEATASSTPAGV